MNFNPFPAVLAGFVAVLLPAFILTFVWHSDQRKKNRVASGSALTSQSDGQVDIRLTSADQRFEVYPRRWTGVVLQVAGILVLVVGLFTATVAVIDTENDNQEMFIIGVVITVLGAGLLLLKGSATRQMVTVNHLELTYRPQFGSQRQCQVRDVFELVASSNQYGGVVAKDSGGNKLFEANRLMVNYQLLLDWLCLVRPDLKIPKSAWL